MLPITVPKQEHMIARNEDAPALIDGKRRFSYRELHARCRRFASGLLGHRTDLGEERIAMLLPASIDYVTALHGIWQAGGIAVPLGMHATVTELEHYLGSTGVSRLLVHTEQAEPVQQLCRNLGVELLRCNEILRVEPRGLPTPAATRRAMILFTSGTTSKPKGVVLTHANIRAQVDTLVQAWQWRSDDVIPLFLPLHHIHGIVNVLSCALSVGAGVHLMPKLDVPRLCADVVADTYTLFMAVPTIYVKLVDYLSTLDADDARDVCAGFARMRLNVSGSAACPVKLFEQWRGLTGQVLLERYGMTEIGMALSNPYHGERRAGFVGQPLPGVTVKLFDEDDKHVDAEGIAGEIRIQGANVFQEYWDNAAATQQSFKDGWFCSGDIALVEDGYFRIMGRSSVDIIKSGGYKLSALEIEGVLLTHEKISEAAVIGVADDTWGEAVAAVVVLREGANLDHAVLKDWCRERMSAYKIPKHLRILDALPRNAMGKVTKPDLQELF